jgi:hypothetical protein
MDFRREGRGFENWISSLEWYKERMPRLKTSTWSGKGMDFWLDSILALGRALFFRGGMLYVVTRLSSEFGWRKGRPVVSIT